jgi:cytochrome c oxidase subunit III
MNPDNTLLTAEERASLELTALGFHRLEEQYRNLEQQRQAASLGMWVFLATEVMFFGTLFLAVGVYHYLYPAAFEKASEKLNWIIGGTNTLVLLLSSLMVVLAVHYAKTSARRRLVVCLWLTVLLGIAFLCLKGLEYYTDYQENLIPGWRFDVDEWVAAGLRADQVPHVQLFLSFYWIMTVLHAVHVTIGICAMLVLIFFAGRGTYSAAYYSPVDVTALYWHFVDIVWIFLLPTLYLLGTHTGEH